MKKNRNVKSGLRRKRKAPKLVVLESKDFLTPPEAATLLRHDQRTIRRWMSQRLLPYFKIGKRTVLFKRSDLEAHLSQHCRHPGLN